MSQRASIWVLAGPLFTLALAAAGEGSLDEGRLDPSWFDGGAKFVVQEEIDYLWVKPGFELGGRTLHFEEWPEPTEFLGEDGKERDENDYRLGRQMASEMHRSFADVFNRHYKAELPSSVEEGEILVQGRVVDCSTGSTAAKVWVGMGAGAGSTAIDVRFVDQASGKVMAGFHQRVVSGTSWSTTDSKFFKWVRKLADELAKVGLQKLYATGKPARK